MIFLTMDNAKLVDYTSFYIKLVIDNDTWRDHEDILSPVVLSCWKLNICFERPVTFSQVIINHLINFTC
ncbi:hypothetical protein Cantr_01852 [Candida viswanathii]|uniref:Uncharacterized protein n=1 Tax=Candida viswanathii TaxID=5486 RepID=A0A367YJP4_9ASCO|nr:hypothetical protein Cantr_01852 [Candida viswanathii]